MIKVQVLTQGRKKQVKAWGGGSGFQGHFFIKRAPSSKFTVAIQRNCL